MADTPSANCPTLTALVLGDDPDTWRAMGFVVDDATIHLATMRISLQATQDAPGWVWSGLTCSGDDLDGIPTRSALEQGDPFGTTPHDPPSTPHDPASTPHDTATPSIDHVVVISPNGERTAAALGGAGLELRRTRDTSIRGAEVRQRFYRPGGAIVELSSPAVPDGDGPAAIWGIAVVCDDLDTAVAALGSRATAPRSAVQKGRRISTISGGGATIRVALMDRHPGAARP